MCAERSWEWLVIPWAIEGVNRTRLLCGPLFHTLWPGAGLEPLQGDERKTEVVREPFNITDALSLAKDLIPIMQRLPDGDDSREALCEWICRLGTSHLALEKDSRMRERSVAGQDLVYQMVRYATDLKTQRRCGKALRERLTFSCLPRCNRHYAKH